MKDLYQNKRQTYYWLRRNKERYAIRFVIAVLIFTFGILPFISPIAL